MMIYLEAEDDANGPVPMEVGAMKGSGKKGDKGKKGYGKGKYGKSFGKYDKNNEYSKGQGKAERPAPNSSFQGYCRSCGGIRRASVGKVTFKE